jgi:hypothetical protein
VRLIEFPDLGHSPQIQAPEPFNKVLVDWLGENKTDSVGNASPARYREWRLPSLARRFFQTDIRHLRPERMQGEIKTPPFSGEGPQKTQLC